MYNDKIYTYKNNILRNLITYGIYSVFNDKGNKIFRTHDLVCNSGFL
jgi:hypothetical protein